GNSISVASSFLESHLQDSRCPGSCSNLCISTSQTPTRSPNSSADHPFASRLLRITSLRGSRYSSTKLFPPSQKAQGISRRSKKSTCSTSQSLFTEWRGTSSKISSAYRSISSYAEIESPHRRAVSTSVRPNSLRRSAILSFTLMSSSSSFAALREWE